MAIEEKTKTPQETKGDECVFWVNHLHKELCGKGINHSDCAGVKCQKRISIQSATPQKKTDAELVTLSVSALKELCIKVRDAKDFETWWKENRP